LAPGRSGRRALLDRHRKKKRWRVSPSPLWGLGRGGDDPWRRKEKAHDQDRHGDDRQQDDQHDDDDRHHDHRHRVISLLTTLDQ
jgi:hypothetical protein